MKVISVPPKPAVVCWATLAQGEAVFCWPLVSHRHASPESVMEGPCESCGHIMSVQSRNKLHFS